MLGLWDKTLKVCATGALIAIPTLSYSGGYGNAGVADDRVGRYAAQTGVWCKALDATIPENLYRQMDCNETGVARSAVANNRVTNEPEPRRRGGLFGLLKPHEPRGGSEPQSDGTATIVSRTQPTPTGGGSDGGDPDTPTAPTTTAKVDKWDRLNDFGITNENWKDQSNDFYREVDEFRSSDSYDGDWSGFEPPT